MCYWQLASFSWHTPPHILPTVRTSAYWRHWLVSNQANFFHSRYAHQLNTIGCWLENIGEDISWHSSHCTHFLWLDIMTHVEVVFSSWRQEVQWHPLTNWRTIFTVNKCQARSCESSLFGNEWWTDSILLLKRRNYFQWLRKTFILFIRVGMIIKEN